MLKILKINIAAFICMAFIFRILFVNICMLPAFNTGSKTLSEHLSSMQKRKRVPVASHANSKEYSITEFCEEDSDFEEDLSKANSPAILSIFHSFFQQTISNTRSTSPFGLIKYELQPKKYLALSVIRI